MKIHFASPVDGFMQSNVRKKRLIVQFRCCITKDLLESSLIVWAILILASTVSLIRIVSEIALSFRTCSFDQGCNRRRPHSPSKIIEQNRKLGRRERQGNKNTCVWVKWQANVDSFCTNFLVRELDLIVRTGENIRAY